MKNQRTCLTILIAAICGVLAFGSVNVFAQAKSGGGDNPTYPTAPDVPDGVPAGSAAVGSFSVNDGPNWGEDIATYSCVETCANLFGGDTTDYNCSTSSDSINNLAWASSFGSGLHCKDGGGEPIAEDFKQGTNTDCGSSFCYISTYVADHCSSTSENFCYSTTPRATFEVNKVFADGNTAEVEVTLSCFTGLPLVQNQTISQGQNVTFVVQAFNSGELDCKVTEKAVAGYTGSYNNNSVVSAVDCSYDNVGFGQNKVCTITNTPKPVAIAVTKEWIINTDLPGNPDTGDYIDSSYKLVLHCDDKIVGGDQKNNGKWKKVLYNGDSNGIATITYTGMVVPNWEDGTSCRVEEMIYDSSVEPLNLCGDLEANINAGASCKIVNTVFYEGIPTLSQYGMAILALLMLGMGFVGFRRFI